MEQPVIDHVEQRKRAAELRAQGLTKEAVAKAVGVSVATIYRWLPPDGVQTGADAEAMRELREQGLTYAEIGRRFGITRAAVSQRLGPSRRHTVKREARKKLNLSLSGEAMAWWEERARERGFLVYSGATPGAGSIAGLLEAIARGEATLLPPPIRAKAK